MSDYMHLIKDCPFRPPAWRWLQAAYRLDHPDETFSRLKDKWIQRAMKIQFGLRAGKAREEISKIDRECRHCLRAYDLWSDNVRLTKTVLESRILAAETVAEIAGKFGLAKRTVEVYEKLFFDVRCKLPHMGYVICTVFGREYCDWSQVPSFETVLKSIGYLNGPWMLDAVLDYVTREVRPQSAGEVGQVLHDIAYDVVDMKAMLALRMLPITDKNRLGILRAGARLLELLAKREEQPAAADLEDPSRLILDEHIRFVEEDPDAYGTTLPKILGMPERMAA